MNGAIKLYEQLAQAFESISTPMISADTAARVMAVLMLFGNNEAMVMSPKFRVECEHIRQMYHIQGGETPDKDFVILFQQYVRELSGGLTDWAKRLYMDRYGITLYE